MSSTTMTSPDSSENNPKRDASNSSAARGIARATGLMMAAVLLSRILGVLRDSIIAGHFGRNAGTDAYQAAFSVPDLLFYLLQSGALSSTIVPIITEYRQQGKDKAADKTVSIVATAIFIFIGVMIVLMEVYAKQLIIYMNPGFDSHRVYMSTGLTRILLPAQLFFFMGGLMMGVLYSRKQFLIPALGPVIYNSGIIIGGVFLSKLPVHGHELGIQGLVWGAVGGAFIGNFLVPFMSVLRLGVKIKPCFEFLHPAAIKVWRMLLPIGLGVSLPNIDQLVNKAFASYMGPGEVTALMNSYRLMLLPIGVFAQAMALAVFPTLSQQAAEKDIKAMRGTMNQSLRNILFLTVPASALMIVLANPIITFLLQHQKFKEADTIATTLPLQLLSLGIFAWSCQSLLTRGFYALQNSKVPVISGAIVSVIFIGMNYASLHLGYGIGGLAVATTLAATIHCLALLYLLTRRLQGLYIGKLLNSTLKTCIATAGLCLASGLISLLMHSISGIFIMPPKLLALSTIILSGGIGIFAFYFVAKIMKMPELDAGISLIKPKLDAISRVLKRNR